MLRLVRESRNVLISARSLKARFQESMDTYLKGAQLEILEYFCRRRICWYVSRVSFQCL